MDEKIKILHLEDTPSDAELIERELKKGNIAFDKIVVDNKIAYKKALKDFNPDIIISDHSMPSFNSIDALKILHATGLKIPFILVSSAVTEQVAVEIMKEGAGDYILKDKLARLPSAVISALDKQKTRKEKESAETELLNVFERITDAFVALDYNWCFTYMNKKAGEIFSLNPKEMIGRNAWTEFLEDIDNNIYKACHQAMAEQQYIHLEEYYLPFDKWFDIRVYPSPEGLSIFFSDITDRIKAEKELKESELFNRSIFSSISSHIAVLDQEGKILAVNKAWCDFAKKNREPSLKQTAIGSNYFEVCGKAALAGDKIAAIILTGIKKVLNKKIPFFEIEYPCLSQSEQRWFLLRATNFIGNNSKVVTIHTDISALKYSEIHLQIALERYDTLAKATSDTIWDLDLVNNKILYNEGITKIMGYQSWEVKDSADWWKQKIHADDVHIVSAALAKILKHQEQSFQIEYRFLCADSTYKNIFDRAFLLYDEQGKPTRMIGAMQDITHHKEEEIRISKAIVEAQEREREQLGMELHDNINQLLASSLIYLGQVNVLQKNKQDFSEMIVKCKTHITDAINETRKLSHQLAPASQEDESLKYVFELLISNMNLNNRFAVNLHFGDFENDRLAQSIRIALYRILQEQMNNILKYADAGIVNVSVTIGEGKVRLMIADNGKGFDTNTVKTGIGLENIKRRTEMYSGKFTCTSSPGQGCKLEIFIPLIVG